MNPEIEPEIEVVTVEEFKRVWFHNHELIKQRELLNKIKTRGDVLIYRKHHFFSHRMFTELVIKGLGKGKYYTDFRDHSLWGNKIFKIVDKKT